jgi:hypothetical protein
VHVLAPESGQAQTAAQRAKESTREGINPENGGYRGRRALDARSKPGVTFFPCLSRTHFSFCIFLELEIEFDSVCKSLGFPLLGVQTINIQTMPMGKERKFSEATVVTRRSSNLSASPTPF